MGSSQPLSPDGLEFGQGAGEPGLLPQVGTVGGHTRPGGGGAGQLEAVIQALQVVLMDQEQVRFHDDLVRIHQDGI